MAVAPRRSNRESGPEPSAGDEEWQAAKPPLQMEDEERWARVKPRVGAGSFRKLRNERDESCGLLPAFMLEGRSKAGDHFKVTSAFSHLEHGLPPVKGIREPVH